MLDKDVTAEEHMKFTHIFCLLHYLHSGNYNIV